MLFKINGFIVKLYNKKNNVNIQDTRFNLENNISESKGIIKKTNRIYKDINDSKKQYHLMPQEILMESLLLDLQDR
jgi:hypothetical protein